MNEAQLAAIQRARLTLGQGVEIDEEDNSLSFQSVEEAQRQAIERAKATLGQSSQGDTDDRSFVRGVGDFAGGVAGAVPKAVGGIVSLGSLVPGLNVVADPVAEALMDAGEWVDDALLSEYQKNINSDMATAMADSARKLGPDASIGDHLKNIASQAGAAAKFVAKNPSQAAMLAGQAIPYLFGGGALARGTQAVVKGGQALRGANATGLSAGTAAAVGEGLMAGGAVTGDVVGQLRDEGITDYTVDRLVGIPAGIATAGIGRLGAKFGGGLDVDTIVANKLSGEAVDLVGDATQRGFLGRVGVGAATEGTEEFFQSGSEQAFTNVGVGNPLSEDVGSSAVLGASAGVGLGGLVAGLQRPSKTGTELDNTLAEEDILLAQQAEADAIEIEQKQEALDTATYRKRVLAAQTFTDQDAFNVERKKAREAQQKKDILNPETDIGQKFEQHLVEQALSGNKIYGPKKIAKAQNDFIKGLNKELKNDFKLEDDSAYEQALDLHAEATITTRSGTVGGMTPQGTYRSSYDDTDRSAVDPMTIPVRRRTDAIKQVEALVEDGSLPPNWTEQNDDLNSAINGQRFNIKKYKEALDKTINPVEEVEAAPEATTEQVAPETNALAEAFSRELPSGTKLSTNEQKVFDTLQSAFNNNEQDDVIQSDGTLNPQRIADRAGLKSRQAAQTALTRLRPKLAKAYNLDQAQIKQALEDTKVNKIEAFDESAAEPVLDASQLGEGMGTQASVGQGNYTLGRGEKLSEEEVQYVNEQAEKPDQYENKRQELADRQRKIDEVKLAKQVGRSAMAMWSNMATDGAVDPSKLTRKDLVEWLGSVQEFEMGGIDEATLSQDQREIEQRYENEATAEKTISREEETDTGGQDSRDAESAEGGDTVEQVGTTDTGKGKESVEGKPYRFTAEDVLAEYADRGSENPTLEQAQNVANVRNGMLARGGKQQPKSKENVPEEDEDYRPSSAEFEESAAKVTVEKKGRKRKPRVKLSLDETEAAAKGTSVEGVKEAARWFIGSDINWRTSVVNNPDDLIGLVLNKEVDISTETLGTILDKGNAQGTVLTDRDGTTRAFFFTDNISPGNERAVVAHELGGHIGMDQVLTREQITKAVTKVREWASSATTSLEKTISERALARLNTAVEQDSTTDIDSETIAYFLEEAVKAGVTPNSESKSDLVSFIRQIWSDFKRALRKLRPANDAALSAQDLVNMARGAARLELVTDFHGSTNSFRSVQQDFLGLGNNAIGVGFYISEDQETGTQYMVQRMDQRKAIGGELQRVDTTVAENEFLLWEAKLSEQSNVLSVVQDMPSVLQSDLREEMNTESLENINGRQLYIGLTALQLRSYKIENSVSDAAYDQANKLRSEGAAAMSIVSSYLDSLGLKGIKTEIGAMSDTELIYNKVIFNADNAIVVGRNEAQDVEPTTTTPGTIRFSVPESETNNQVSWTRRNMGDGAAEFLTNVGKVSKQPIDATKNLDRLIRENKEKMPSARKWYNAMLQAQATANDILSMVESVINQSRRVSRERKVLVNDFLGSSTFFQKWGYDPQWTDPKTNQPIKVTIDPIMKRKYDRLTAEEKQVVRDVFSHGRKMQLMMREIADNLGVSKFFKLDSGLTGPYAPLKRFGKHVGELKSQTLLDAEEALRTDQSAANRKRVDELKSDGDHYVISFFESPGAAETFVLANREKYAYAEASEKAVTEEESRPGGAQAYQKIIGAVNANLAGLDQDSKNAMAKMVRDMYFQTLDESNARLSGTKRLNRAGYDKDILRAFAVHGMSQANLVAQMKHGAEISSALVEARKEAGKDSKKLMPVYNKVALKFQRMMSPRAGMFADIETNIMKANSFYMLTSSLGYMFQNLTQAMYAAANIAGEFGWKNSQTWGKLFSGYGVAKKVINTSFMNQVLNVASMSALGGNSTVELDFDKAPPELRPVLQELSARGLLDVGIAEDLRHVNMSPNPAMQFYDEVTHRLYQSARYVEATNRIASAVAAFRMAQLNPQKMRKLKMTPAEFAVQIVQDTQGNFSQLDAPAAFDVLPKAPLQFRKYQFQMAWLHIDAAKQALRGADPEIKAAGYRKLSFMLGYTGVVGGLTAVPAAKTVIAATQAAISFLAGDDDEGDPEFDLERSLRENIGDERVATLLARGVPAALGWDFSQKLDQSDLFMPYNSKYVELDPSRDGALLFAAQLFLGPTGTQVGNVGNVADFINRGNYYRAAEYMMPKGLRSYLETIRYSGKGYETRSGLTITDPTTFDMFDFLTNAVGLPSTDINQIKWTRGQQIEIQKHFSDETSKIKRRYLAANEDRDREAMSELRDEWKELQKAKDRIRPFFNNNRNVLKRASVSDLLKYPRARRREQLRLDRTTGR